jgi:ribonuclease D
VTDPIFQEPISPAPTPAASEIAAPEAVVAEQAPHVHVDVIDTVEGYQQALESIRGGYGPVAIDAERASGYRYSQRAYLIQLYRRGAGTFLFDPPAIGDFSELSAEIADVEWILHAASQDLACLREVGLNPARLFDTELAARLAGLPRVGLGAVVEELLGIHLAKEHSAADWSTRPLPQSWLVYAALDVELLVDVKEKLEAVLEEAGKTELVHQEFEAVLAKDFGVPRAEPWRRLSGLHTVRGARNLAIARELWIARDEYAREIDTAPGRLVPDQSLVAAAKLAPATKRELAGLKEFIGRASRSQLDRWFAAVERGAQTTELPSVRPPGESIPAPRLWADKNANADRRLKRVRPAIADVAAELNLPVENLLTPDTLRRVAWAPPQPLTAESLDDALTSLGARPWQREATVPVILTAFVEADQGVGDATRDDS